MLLINHTTPGKHLGQDELRTLLFSAFDRLGPRKKVLVIPPDYTRVHSQAGEITRLAYEYYGNRITDILPALGTHRSMTTGEISKMFPGVPARLFRYHDWRKDVVTIGEVPSEYIQEITAGKLNFSWPVQVNRLLMEGGFDLILSPGQVVPHEVAGMANYNKNIFVGTGGALAINRSHFVGAVTGLENIMGRADNPVRKVLDYASEHFTGNMPLVYLLTVIAADGEGKTGLRGLFAGDDRECFLKAAALSLELNFRMLEKPLEKVVVYLGPDEFKSTWLGNKAVYRTRMAIADGGELIILAPGVKEFGEDGEIDRLIRRYGYLTTPEILAFTEKNTDLQNNLGAAAHLIHGSAENRFRITYCPGHLSKEEIEGVNYRYADPGAMMKKYDPERLTDGFQTVDGEEIFYISNPALGLWSTRSRFRVEK